MSKKKYVSSRVVLRSLTSSRQTKSPAYSYFMLACGIGLFVLGWLFVFHPDWLLTILK